MPSSTSPAPKSRTSPRRQSTRESRRRKGTRDTMSTAVWDGKVFAGDWRETEGGALEVTAPATGEVLATVGRATAADVAESVRIAGEAQAAWAAATYDVRAAVLRRAAQILEADPDRLARWIVEEA